MNQLYNLLKQQLEVLEDMTNNTINEINNFNKFEPEELFQIATEKEELMNNLVFVRNEIDIYIHKHSELNLEEFQSMFEKVENAVNTFKNENKKLMILTLSMQKLYDDLVDNVEDKSIINMEI